MPSPITHCVETQQSSNLRLKNSASSLDTVNPPIPNDYPTQIAKQVPSAKLQNELNFLEVNVCIPLTRHTKLPRFTALLSIAHLKMCSLHLFQDTKKALRFQGNVMSLILDRRDAIYSSWNFQHLDLGPQQKRSKVAVSAQKPILTPPKRRLRQQAEPCVYLNPLFEFMP